MLAWVGDDQDDAIRTVLHYLWDDRLENVDVSLDEIQPRLPDGLACTSSDDHDLATSR